MSKKINIHSTLSFFKRANVEEILEKYNLSCELVPIVSPQGGTLEEDLEILNRMAKDIKYLVTGVTPINKNFIELATNLKHVAMLGIGVEHLDIATATKHQVVVSNTPGANARSVAEFCLGMSFDLARKLSTSHYRLMQGNWKPNMGFELLGKTLGIVGFGNIGQCLAGLAKAIGMEVIFYNRSSRPELAKKLGCLQAKNLEELMGTADIVSINLPAMPNNQVLITAKHLALMKTNAVIVNAGRGSLIDFDALLEALANKKIAGAGLDVYPVEPLDKTLMDAMPHALYTLPNVVCTPHIAGSTQEAILNSTQLCCHDLRLTADGKKALHAVNPEVYK